MAEHVHNAKTARPPARRTIALVKGEQRWRFHFAPGDEAVLIEALGQLAEDPDHPLDWFDVAVISHQVTHPVAEDSSSVSGQAPGPAADAA
jgi:hypothetical protein